MSSKKLIINLNNDEHIITETPKSPNAEKKKLQSAKIIDIDSNIINSNQAQKRKTKSRNKNDTDSYLNNILFDTNIVTKPDIDTDKKTKSKTLENNIPHIALDSEDINYQEKLSKYLQQQQDIIKKRDKLQSRITNPKYANKQSLYISDLEKCNTKLSKLEKNIKICKHNIKKDKHTHTHNDNTLNSHFTHKPNRPMIKPFNTGTNTTIDTPLQIKNRHNIDTFINFENNNNNTNTNSTNNTNNTNKTNNTNNNINNSINNNNTNFDINNIETELNKLESELRLSSSIIPSITNQINSNTILNSNINNNSITQEQNQPVINKSKHKSQVSTQELQKKKSKTPSAPTTINSQLRTLREKENFYKEQQRRIQEKFKSEMHKIKKLKLQKKEMERLKSLDKQRKQTFILEQKLKKIERYKFLINKLTNLECVYNINNENNAEKSILNKQSKLSKTYQPFTYGKYSNVIQTKNNNTQQQMNIQINKQLQTNKSQQSENSYFNKFINAINKFGFMGVGESINPKSHKAKTKLKQPLVEEFSSKSKNVPSSITFTNPELIELQKLRKKYTLKDYTPKHYSTDVLKIKYFNPDDNWIETDTNNQELIEYVKLELPSNCYNIDNNNLDYSSRIKYDNIKLDTLNELLTKSKYNISKCYFDKYSNNFKLNQFKSGCKYMDFNYDKVMINTIFKNKMVNTSQLVKYKIVDFLNQYYQNMDNNFKINFI